MFDDISNITKKQDNKIVNFPNKKVLQSRNFSISKEDALAHQQFIKANFSENPWS